MLRECILPQSEVIRAILLEDSPYCCGVPHQEIHRRLRHAVQQVLLHHPEVGLAEVLDQTDLRFLALLSPQQRRVASVQCHSDRCGAPAGTARGADLGVGRVLWQVQRTREAAEHNLPAPVLLGRWRGPLLRCRHLLRQFLLLVAPGRRSVSLQLQSGSPTGGVQL